MPDDVNTISILTYHSISNEPGPTSMAPEVFQMQMSAVAELGVDVVSLDQVERWMKGDIAFEGRTVAITFDDAFQDFADAAFPVLQRLGFASSVFVPTSVVGRKENWIGANDPPRQLMDWTVIRQISEAGVSFGSHTRAHLDLTRLNAVRLDAELAASRRTLEDALGKSAPHFAPPYGRVSAKVKHALARHYSLSVGVRLDDAARNSPIHDLPRIEMHCYRDLSRWRAFLERRGSVYFQSRRVARSIREAAEGASRLLVH